MSGCAHRNGALFLPLMLLIGLGFAQPVSQPPKQTSRKSAQTWRDDKVSVRVETPFISKSGSLALAYTVTNNSGTDLVLFREGEGQPTDILKGGEEVKLFRKLKSSDNYEEIWKSDNSIFFPRTSLPAEVPVRLIILFSIPKEQGSSWPGKKEITPQEAIARVLPDVDAMVLLIPGRRIRITLPVKH
jgi:hypothetical protein